jgi:autophagy-related protein 9
VCLLEELVSPIVTPFILINRMRHKSLDIVDFLRSFTVDVAGVGDVCSFAQLDVKRHGHPDVCCRRNHDILIIRG